MPSTSSHPRCLDDHWKPFNLIWYVCISQKVWKETSYSTKIFNSLFTNNKLTKTFKYRLVQFHNKSGRTNSILYSTNGKSRKRKIKEAFSKIWLLGTNHRTRFQIFINTDFSFFVIGCFPVCQSLFSFPQIPFPCLCKFIIWRSNLRKSRYVDLLNLFSSLLSALVPWKEKVLWY